MMIAVKKPNGGIRPIGVGEVVRRIITKVLARETREEIKAATEDVQVAGLKGACEAAVGAMENQYEAGKTLLILDAEGAYCSLDRTKAMRTTAEIVPEAYCSIRNFYSPNTLVYH